MTCLLAERGCERVVLELARRLDPGDPRTVCDLFNPDGVWEWPYNGRRIEGREALRAYFRRADRACERRGLTGRGNAAGGGGGGAAGGGCGWGGGGCFFCGVGGGCFVGGGVW
ncbi:nuclear transport factor 2 family protein, partial [Streptomyces sp. NPDC054829]